MGIPVTDCRSIGSWFTRQMLYCQAQLGYPHYRRRSGRGALARRDARVDHYLSHYVLVIGVAVIPPPRYLSMRLTSSVGNGGDMDGEQSAACDLSSDGSGRKASRHFGQRENAKTQRQDDGQRHKGKITSYGRRQSPMTICAACRDRRDLPVGPFHRVAIFSCMIQSRRSGSGVRCEDTLISFPASPSCL